MGCGKCGRLLAEGEPIYLVSAAWGTYRGGFWPARNVLPLPLPGSAGSGRAVLPLRPSRHPERATEAAVILCGLRPKCRNAAAARARRCVPGERACATCGEGFVPKRNECPILLARLQAVGLSPACRSVAAGGRLVAVSPSACCGRSGRPERACSASGNARRPKS